MGARNYSFSGTGYGAQEIFDGQMSDNAYEHGHNSYNGYGYGAYLCGCKKKFDKYVQTNDKKAREIIQDFYENDNGGKNEIYYIDLGVVEYHIIKRKIKNESPKKAPKFELRYCLNSGEYCGREDNKILESHKDKKVIAEKLLKAVDKYPNAYMSKEYVCVSGITRVSTVETEVSARKARPKTIPAGTILKEVHKYIFFGWVAE